uniref:Uncharacterized protein n=2 Tax=Leersia perrieri TaxID=77586 RepID=A0A0D9XY31_9ORYZ
MTLVLQSRLWPALHTMFGCAKQPGIMYRALRDMLAGGGGGGGASSGGGDEGDGRGEDGAGCAGFWMGLFLQVDMPKKTEPESKSRTLV